MSSQLDLFVVESVGGGGHPNVHVPNRFHILGEAARVTPTAMRVRSCALLQQRHDSSPLGQRLHEHALAAATMTGRRAVLNRSRSVSQKLDCKLTRREELAIE
ncbi:MAG: hypothetical protein ACRD1X_03865 [Vicinamibacteria bacterium]